MTLCGEVVLFQSLICTEMHLHLVCPLLGGLSSFGVSFIEGFTAPIFPSLSPSPPLFTPLLSLIAPFPNYAPNSMPPLFMPLLSLIAPFPNYAPNSMPPLFMPLLSLIAPFPNYAPNYAP